MARSAQVAVVAVLLLAVPSLATAQNRGLTVAHGKSQGPDINETTSRPAAADPYYRLSDSCYGHSDPYRGLFDLYVVPPYSPGYSYGHARPSECYTTKSALDEWCGEFRKESRKNPPQPYAPKSIIVISHSGRNAGLGNILALRIDIGGRSDIPTGTEGSSASARDANRRMPVWPRC